MSAPLCREAAEERREAGALLAGVPRPVAGPPAPVFRVEARGAGRAPARGEMANFVSGLSVANKCLPVSGDRRMLIDSPRPVLY